MVRNMVIPVEPADPIPDRPPEIDNATEHWRKENRAAIEAYNEWIDEYGLPLAEFRQF